MARFIYLTQKVELLNKQDELFLVCRNKIIKTSVNDLNILFSFSPALFDSNITSLIVKKKKLFIILSKFGEFKYLGRSKQSININYINDDSFKFKFVKYLLDIKLYNAFKLNNYILYKKKFLGRTRKTIQKFYYNFFEDLLSISKTLSQLYKSNKEIDGFIDKIFREEISEISNFKYSFRKEFSSNDRINHLLDLCYSLYKGYLIFMLIQKNFYLNQGIFNKEFSEDLLEIFKPDIAKFILLIIAKEYIVPEDFNTTYDGKFYLNRIGLKVFLKLFNEYFFYLRKQELDDRLDFVLTKIKEYPLSKSF